MENLQTSLGNLRVFALTVNQETENNVCTKVGIKGSPSKVISSLDFSTSPNFFPKFFPLKKNPKPVRQTPTDHKRLLRLRNSHVQDLSFVLAMVHSGCISKLLQTQESCKHKKPHSSPQICKSSHKWHQHQ